jgi:hypothetical protein
VSVLSAAFLPGAALVASWINCDGVLSRPAINASAKGMTSA